MNAFETENIKKTGTTIAKLIKLIKNETVFAFERIDVNTKLSQVLHSLAQEDSIRNHVQATQYAIAPPPSYAWHASVDDNEHREGRR